MRIRPLQYLFLT